MISQKMKTWHRKKHMDFLMKHSIEDLFKFSAEMEEMEKFFEERTKRHIGLVKKFCKKIHDLNPQVFEGLIERGEEHDQSKYRDPERVPYIYITWDYRCRDKNEDFGVSEEIKDLMDAASEHHVHSNSHHPEFHCDETTTINRDDRDEVPDKMIDATKMSVIDIAEMLADWWAMSEEKGEVSPKKWADKNVNKRWKFTDEQKDLIYELIDRITI
jgi:hypothetical protein